MDLNSLLNKMTLTEKLYQLQQVNSDIYIDSGNMPITGPDFLLEFDNNYKYEVSSVYNSYGAERNIKIQEDFLKNSKNKDNKGVTKKWKIMISYSPCLTKTAKK